MNTTLYYPFDTTPGNGSSNKEEEWLDVNTTASENQWSTAETTFYYWEADDQKFKDLYDTHHGKGESDRDATIRRAHMVADAKTFCSILELPETQRNRIVELVRDFDFSSQRFGGKPYEKILLAFCSLVSDEALTRKLKKHDRQVEGRRIICDERFKQLMDANGLGSKEHNRIRQMLREKTDEF